MQLWPAGRPDAILCSWEVRYILVLIFNPDTIHFSFRDQTYCVRTVRNVTLEEIPTYVSSVSNFFTVQEIMAKVLTFYATVATVQNEKVPG
jgi:hypothetical protein